MAPSDESPAPSVVPSSHLDLLERPLFTHLATIRPDGTVQVNPMWFLWDSSHVRFTSTTKRQKYRNVVENPNVAMSVNDPSQPYRYLEVRGQVESIEPDSTGAFFFQLAERYQLHVDELPDAPDRVIYIVRPTHATYQ